MTKKLIETAMFTAILAILAQLSIPMPSGVPITLQTFAVALTGVVLAWKYALASTAVYILLGAVGVPVFTGFAGGVHVLVGYTGGFIWGFLFMAALCGIGTTINHKLPCILLSLTGLIICHLLGAAQFMIAAGRTFIESLMLVSLPYLIKDIVSVILACFIGGEIRKRLLKAGLI